LEARLGAALLAEGHGRVVTAMPVPAEKTAGANEELADAVGAVAAPPVVENGANVWPDESAEGAFIAEARQRGEPVVAAVATVEAVDEKEDAKRAMPPLAELVQRLSPEVRETLDDLFRVKFTTVRRVPKKVLKTSGA
jgi:hypothetical protein